MAASQAGGRLTRLLTWVSLLCLVAAVFYIAVGKNACDRIGRLVQVVNDVPARIALWVAAPWSSHRSEFWSMYEYFATQRVVIADAVVRQLYGYRSYKQMCDP
ncbi:MAG: hypothetical protein N2690_00145 [Rhodocyclaceae bacterium]|nr:hypothetical protein [Rhodocyclaceae bacterium]